MLINSANLAALRTGFSTAFKNGLGMTSSLSARITTPVPATTKEQKYGWMGKLPNVRKWAGERVIQNISESDYSIKEEPWELTLGVDRDDIETDNLGIYAPLFTEMGQSTGGFKEQLIWGLLAAGFTTNCYDGQNFFDTDHPVLDANGVAQSVANTDGGAGTPWFLLDTSRYLKPIIMQTRRDFSDIVSLDRATDENVFMRNEYLYGVDARFNVGFGFWQMAWGSKQTLDAAHFETARAALGGMKGDHGRPLGGNGGNLLVVPSSLEGAGRRLLNTQLGAGGATNEWEGAAELLVVPWLA